MYVLLIFVNLLRDIYCVLQIIHSGKVLWFLWVNRLLQKFSSEIACAIGFGYTRLASNCESFPAFYKSFPP